MDQMGATLLLTGDSVPVAHAIDITIAFAIDYEGSDWGKAVAQPLLRDAPRGAAAERLR